MEDSDESNRRFINSPTVAVDLKGFDVSEFIIDSQENSGFTESKHSKQQPNF